MDYWGLLGLARVLISKMDDGIDKGGGVPPLRPPSLENPTAGEL